MPVNPSPIGSAHFSRARFCRQKLDSRRHCALPGPERDAITAGVRERFYCAARLPVDSAIVELLALAEFNNRSRE
jgi:hypothetical protein